MRWFDLRKRLPGKFERTPFQFYPTERELIQGEVPSGSLPVSLEKRPECVALFKHLCDEWWAARPELAAKEAARRADVEARERARQEQLRQRFTPAFLRDRPDHPEPFGHGCCWDFGWDPVADPDWNWSSEMRDKWMNPEFRKGVEAREAVRDAERRAYREAHADEIAADEAAGDRRRAEWAAGLRAKLGQAQARYMARLRGEIPEADAEKPEAKGAAESCDVETDDETDIENEADS
jgi:hypothetical protein